MNIWFGDHEGKEVSELPDDYLVWLTEKASSPITPNSFTDEEKRKVRERWKDLLSEVEDEINERQNENQRSNYFT
jgi:hypothetical protein